MTESENLRRRITLLTVLSGAALIAALAALGMSARRPARSMVEFKDSTGAVAARVGMHGGELVIVNSDGRKLFGFGLNVGAPSIRIYDENYKKRVQLEIGDRGPQLVLLSDSAKPQVRIGGMRASADLMLYDRNGYRRIMLATNESGAGFFIADDKRRQRIQMNADPKSSNLVVYDTAANAIFGTRK